MANYRNSYRPGSAGRKENSGSIVSWFKNRKERRAQLRDQAAKMITNKLAENERRLIDLLNSIDFDHSKLSEAVLEQKSRPDQNCCDLEYSVRGCVNLIRNHPQTIKVDIRGIDEKLIQIALIFRQAVEQGDAKAAYAARVGLVRGLSDIRCKIAGVQPELVGQFVRINSEYLDQWISLIEMAQYSDQMEENVDNLRAEYSRSSSKKKQDIDDTLTAIKNDPEKAAAYEWLKEHDSPADRANWSEMQREIHANVIESLLNYYVNELQGFALHQKEDLLASNNTKFELLKTKLASLPIAVDPNMMNKFQEAMDQMFHEFAENDVEISEAMDALDNFSERLRTLENATGIKKQMEKASQHAGKLIEEAQEAQKLQTGVTARQHRERMRRLGIMSDTEQAVLAKQIENEIRAEEEAMRQQAEEELARAEQTVAEEEDDQLYN